ncbi:unnamed protein product, partial [Onchocerca ochengi]|uniref:DNA methylase n=1 Tax=Onchocerca ochengi TaxID=42157 RepID=A0A182EXU2_ONCOC
MNFKENNLLTNIWNIESLMKIHFRKFDSTFISGQPFPEEADCPVEFDSYTKKRQKMHEMAVKQKLITEQDPKGFGYLYLSAEEKRALTQEGYKLPTMLPLSKSEQEALKVVRRKIKNK